MSDPRVTPWDVRGWDSERVGDLTPAVVKLAMAVDPDGFIGVRVRDVAGLVDMLSRAQTEVARLRSDEWLEKAAREIAQWPPAPVALARPKFQYFLAILRKHRDGKA